MNTAPDDRQLIRDAQLANMRQELLAPVGAIVGYGEMGREAAVESDLHEIGEDLDRVLESAHALYGAVNKLLDKDAADDLFAGKDTDVVQQTLRHDLRTPINAIKGYGEMVLEDLEDLGGEALRPDLERLLDETNRLLSQLDGIIDFSLADSDAESRGVGATDLASGLGVTFKQLHKFETGANRISAAKLYQCAQILNSGIEYFFVGLPATSTRKKGRKTTADGTVNTKRR